MGFHLSVGAIATSFSRGASGSGQGPALREGIGGSSIPRFPKAAPWHCSARERDRLPWTSHAARVAPPALTLALMLIRILAQTNSQSRKKIALAASDRTQLVPSERGAQGAQAAEEGFAPTCAAISASCPSAKSRCREGAPRAIPSVHRSADCDTCGSETASPA
jgi:hypothetical protein